MLSICYDLSYDNIRFYLINWHVFVKKRKCELREIENSFIIITTVIIYIVAACSIHLLTVLVVAPHPLKETLYIDVRSPCLSLVFKLLSTTYWLSRCLKRRQGKNILLFVLCKSLACLHLPLRTQVPSLHGMTHKFLEITLLKFHKM